MTNESFIDVFGSSKLDTDDSDETHNKNITDTPDNEPETSNTIENNFLEFDLETSIQNIDINSNFVFYHYAIGIIIFMITSTLVIIICRKRKEQAELRAMERRCSIISVSPSYTSARNIASRQSLFSLQEQTLK